MERDPRHLLLPGWFRFCAWCAFLFGSAFAATILAGAIAGASLGPGEYLDVFGQRYQGPLRAWQLYLMAAWTAFQAYAALTLLLGRREGRLLGLVAGYGGLLLWLVFLTVGGKTGHLRVDLGSPAVAGVVVAVLHSVKQRWNARMDPLALDPELPGPTAA